MYRMIGTWLQWSSSWKENWRRARKCSLPGRRLRCRAKSRSSSRTRSIVARFNWNPRNKLVAFLRYVSFQFTNFGFGWFRTSRRTKMFPLRAATGGLTSFLTKTWRKVLIFFSFVSLVFVQLVHCRCFCFQSRKIIRSLFARVLAFPTIRTGNRVAACWSAAKETLRRRWRRNVAGIWTRAFYREARQYLTGFIDSANHVVFIFLAYFVLFEIKLQMLCVVSERNATLLFDSGEHFRSPPALALCRTISDCSKSLVTSPSSLLAAENPKSSVWNNFYLIL